MRLATLAASLLILLTATTAQAQSEFPALTGPVVDLVDEIPADEEARLDASLRDFQRRTGHQLQVVTLPDLGGRDVESYGRALGEHWKLGRKGVDDGIILIHAIKERKVRIEVGRGAEPYLTDAMSEGIVQNVIIPRFKEGEFSQGILDGSAKVMKEAAITPEQRKEDARRAALQHARDVQAMKDGFFAFITWIAGIAASIAGAFGLYRLATRGKRARAKAAEEARIEAERLAAAERARVRAAEREKERAAEAERARERAIQEAAERERMREREAAAARAREEEARIAAEKRATMLAAMTPAKREAFLARERADEAERQRVAAAAREAARQEQLRRDAQRREREQREEEERRVRRQREEREEEERRSRRRSEEAAAAAAAASSSTYGSSYGSSSSSSSSNDSWSGGGGSFGGGGASGDY